MQKFQIPAKDIMQKSQTPAKRSWRPKPNTCKKIMQKFPRAPKKIMQNDLRQTGQKQYICMGNNMHKLRPEIVDYSVWLKIGSLWKASYNYKDQRAHQFCAISGGTSRPGLSDGSTLVCVLQSAEDQHCQLFWNNLRLFTRVTFLQNNGLMSLRYPVFVK